MRRIYKYPVNADGGMVSIIAPIVRVLKVDWQGQQAMLWAEIDEEYEDVELLIVSIGTGWAVSSNLKDWRYLNTLFDIDGLVWHFYGKVVEIGSEDAVRDAYLELLEDEDIIWN